MTSVLSGLCEDGSTFTQGSAYTTSQGIEVSQRKCSYNCALGCPFVVRFVYDPEEEEANLEVSPPLHTGKPLLICALNRALVTRHFAGAGWRAARPRL